MVNQKRVILQNTETKNADSFRITFIAHDVIVHVIKSNFPLFLPHRLIKVLCYVLTVGEWSRRHKKKKRGFRGRQPPDIKRNFWLFFPHRLIKVLCYVLTVGEWRRRHKKEKRGFRGRQPPDIKRNF